MIGINATAALVNIMQADEPRQQLVQGADTRKLLVHVWVYLLHAFRLAAMANPARNEEVCLMAGRGSEEGWVYLHHG